MVPFVIAGIVLVFVIFGLVLRLDARDEAKAKQANRAQREASRQLLDAAHPLGRLEIIDERYAAPGGEVRRAGPSIGFGGDTHPLTERRDGRLGHPCATNAHSPHSGGAGPTLGSTAVQPATFRLYEHLCLHTPIGEMTLEQWNARVVAEVRRFYPEFDADRFWAEIGHAPPSPTSRIIPAHPGS